MLQGHKLFGSSPLPQLPQNARYVFHENRCFDWGTFGWAIAERKLDTSRYAYIIFMNSSVRGPFLPAFWPVRARWRHAGVHALAASLLASCCPKVHACLSRTRAHDRLVYTGATC